MKIFYGAAIQGLVNRKDTAHINIRFLKKIKEMGASVFSEHTSGKNIDETAFYLEQTFEDIPPRGPERVVFVRNKMVEGVEGPIDGAIFEVSTPSLGTGVEIAHAYLRRRMGLPEIPILCLYWKDYWPGNLSTMIRGLTQSSTPSLRVLEYSSLEEGEGHIEKFLRSLR